MASPTRILVTGASGFLGRHLLAPLRAAYPAATLIAGFRQGAMSGAVSGADASLALDLLDPQGMETLLRDARPDAVVHLAAQAAVGESFQDPDRSWRINADGTRALGDILLRHLPETMLILASSAEVYGLTFRRGVPVDEDAAMAPTNPYAASKAAADIALGEMALRGLRLVRLRLFNQIGPGQSDAYVVAAFSRQIAEAEAGLRAPVLKVGALDRWRDFVDVRDGCAACVAALRHADALPAGMAINIASGTARRVGDILDALLARSRISFSVETEQPRVRPTDVEHVRADTARARRFLEWEPRCDWDETLDLILADWRTRVNGGAGA